jgi:hypothetical protein
MKQIAVSLAALVIVASILPSHGIQAQGQSVITSRVIDSSWKYFPCAAGVIEKQNEARIERSQSKAAIKSGDRRRSRKPEKRL